MAQATQKPSLRDLIEGQPKKPSLRQLIEQPKEEPGFFDYVKSIPSTMGRAGGNALIKQLQALGRQIIESDPASQEFGIPPRPRSTEEQAGVDQANQFITKTGDTAQRGLEAVTPISEKVQNAPEGVGKFFGVDLPSGIASTGVLGLEALAGGLPAAVAGSALTQGGQVYSDAKAKGASDEKAFAAQVANYYVGGLDALEGNVLSKFMRIGKVLAGVNEATKGGLAAIVKGAAKTGLYEGTTESVQQVLENAVAKHVAKYDEDRDIMQDVVKSFALGAGVGVIGGGAEAAIEGKLAAGGQAKPTLRNLIESAAQPEPSQTAQDLTGQPETQQNVVQSLVQPGAAEAVQMALPQEEATAPEQAQPQAESISTTATREDVGGNGDRPAAASPPTLSDSLESIAPEDEPGFDVPVHDRVQRFVEAVQNDFVRAVNLEKAAPIKAEGASLAQTEVLHPGRVHDETELLERRTETPIVKLMRKSKIPVDTVGEAEPSIREYEIAKTAPTANKVLSTPKVDENGKVGRQPGRYVTEEDTEGNKTRRFVPFHPETNPPSGMSDSEAADIVKRAEQGPKGRFYREIHKLEQERSERELAYQVKTGLRSQAQVDFLKERWGPDFVHLQTIYEDEEGIGQAIGGGKSFAVRGRESQTRKGRMSLAGNPIVTGLASSRRTIARGEHNVVMNKLSEIVTANPHPELWEVAKHRPENLDSIRFVKKGEPQFLVVRDSALYEALSRVGKVPARIPLVKAIDAVLRFKRNLLIDKNPFFPPINLVKDVGNVTLGMTAQEGPKFAAEVFAKVGPSIKAAYRVLADENAKGPLEDRFRESRAVGGHIGWDQVFTLGEKLKEFKERVERPSWKEAVGVVTTAIDTARNAGELGVRLAVYDTAIAHGYSPEEAGVMMRNASANFSKRGSYAPILSRMWLFSPGNVQGTTQELRAFKKGPVRGAIVAGTMVGLGYALSKLSRQLADHDDLDSEWDKMSPFVKAKHMGVAYGKYFFGAPLPWGWNVFYYAGVGLEEWQNGKPAAEVTKNLVMETVDAFSPVMFESTASVMPTVVQPLYSLAANEDPFGRRIYPEPMGNKSATTPPSENFFPSVNPIIREAMQIVNRMSGGNTYERGAVSINPEGVEYLASWITQGFGSESNRVLKQGIKIAEGKQDSIADAVSALPVTRRFVMKANPLMVSDRYKGHMAELDIAKAKQKDKIPLSLEQQALINTEGAATATAHDINALWDRIEGGVDREVVYKQLDQVMLTYERTFRRQLRIEQAKAQR